MSSPAFPGTESSPSNRALALLLFPALLLAAAAAHGQAEIIRVGEAAAPDLELVPVALSFDPAKTTSVRTFAVEDPAKLPSRQGDKQPTPGWTTILYETAEGIFPGNWDVGDMNPADGFDFWDDVSCRAFAGSWSIWCADAGDRPDCTTYDNNMESWMIFGPFSLADALDARAEFRVWSQTEGPDVPFDSVSWLASTDGVDYHGMRLGSNTSGWAEGVFDFKNVPTVGDLSGAPSVWFAFVFTSDGSVNSFEGTYLDDIVIEKLTDARVDLEAGEVFFRDQPRGGGAIITDPQPGDELYPHFSFRLFNESLNGKLWDIELDAATLCFFHTGASSLPPGEYVGSCVAPVSLTSGIHTLRGEVDPDGAIAESDESNNVASRTYDVPGLCTDDLADGRVCLFGDRFEFTMTWTDMEGVTRPVVFDKYTHQSALGFFNNPNDIAVVVKVARGCVINDHWWIWTGGASGGGASWSLEVLDVQTGRRQTYSKPLGEFTHSTRDDTSFPCS